MQSDKLRCHTCSADKNIRIQCDCHSVWFCNDNDCRSLSLHKCLPIQSLKTLKSKAILNILSFISISINSFKQPVHKVVFGRLGDDKSIHLLYHSFELWNHSELNESLKYFCLASIAQSLFIGKCNSKVSILKLVGPPANMRVNSELRVLN
jgi:hypothetical protein